MVKQQGYMLAQIVTEIHAPDLAAGDVGERVGVPLLSRRQSRRYAVVGPCHVDVRLGLHESTRAASVLP